MVEKFNQPKHSAWLKNLTSQSEYFKMRVALIFDKICYKIGPRPSPATFHKKYFFKIGQPRSLFHLFLSFQTHITKFAANRYVKKCPSSIRCRESNSRHLEHESPPITTRPSRAPALKDTFLFKVFKLDRDKARSQPLAYLEFGKSLFGQKVTTAIASLRDGEINDL